MTITTHTSRCWAVSKTRDNRVPCWHKADCKQAALPNCEVPANTSKSERERERESERERERKIVKARPLTNTMTSCRSRQSLVEREAELFAQQKSMYARRAKSLQPTLKEFRSKSFTDYVRHALFDTESDNTNSNSRSSSNNYCHDTRRNRNSTDKNNNKAHKVEWNHGLVKITLPEGWWDESGIAKDRSARGPAVRHVHWFNLVLEYSLFRTRHRCTLCTHVSVDYS